EVRRLGIDAVELRDLVPEPGDHEAARALVVGRVALVAPPDVVRRRLKEPDAAWILALVLRIGEEHSVPEVLVALESRRIPVHAAEPAAQLELTPCAIEQA